MTAIRPIRDSEAEPFLRLLCEVFGLDFERAHDVFFSEPLFELDRKWALFEGTEIISILTTTELEFGWGPAFGIAGVATRPKRRGEGHASKLLQKVCTEMDRRGEGGALLFAKEPSLYERNGFEALDRVVRAPIVTSTENPILDPLDIELVKFHYAEWASGHPDRLRRSPRRWDYWNWHFRIPSPFQNGYLCAEAGLLREAIFATPVPALPMALGTEWFGTTLLADQLEIPMLTTPVVELYLMGKSIPGVPQIFMTDQF